MSGPTGKLVVVDVETTGLHADRCGLVEIGAVLLDLASLETGAEFATPVRVCYWHEWTDEAEAVHGTPRTVAEDPARPEEGEALLRFFEWLANEAGPGRHMLAGMNPGFDLGFLRAVAERTDPSMPAELRRRIGHRTVDLHTLALRAAMECDPGEDPARLHTDAIYEMLGMEAEPRPHRALTGARMEAEAIALLLA